MGILLSQKRLVNLVLLGLLLHAPLNPLPRFRSLLVQLLLRLVHIVQHGVAGGHVAAGLEAGALEQLVQPLLQVGEFLDVDACPGYFI